MGISIKDIKLLWSKAAGRCSICRTPLTYNSDHGSNVSHVGEQAHIVAESDNGPRGNSILSLEERNSYPNLILLCPTHHTVIDDNEADYPVEKLHSIKQLHETWVYETLQYSPIDLQYSHTLETDSLADFVRQWLDFSDFFSLYFSEIQTNIRNSDENWLFWGKSRANIKEWHSRRTALRELLYLTGEDNLVLKIVHNWERLERQERYIEEGNYKTPFSFLLDFVNPVAMVNLHGDAVWIALQISEEFIEILSWKYPKVKEVLTHRYSSE